MPLLVQVADQVDYNYLGVEVEKFNSLSLAISQVLSSYSNIYN